MTYKNIFCLLFILSSPLTCHASGYSSHVLEAFDRDYRSDTDYAGFKVSPYYTDTIVASHRSKSAYTTALTRQFHLYKLSLGGGGGEAAATPTEIEDMRLNAFEAVKNAFDQWNSYLEPKGGVGCILWSANPGNKRFEIERILASILDFVPTASEHYSDTVRTALENFRKDVTRALGAPNPIADGDLTFTTIGGRITAIKALLPAPSAFRAMGSPSTSRDIYAHLWAESMRSRTFSQGDLKKAISWAKRRIGWLEQRISQLSLEVERLRTELVSNIVTINDTTVPDRVTLSTAGVTITTGPALHTINLLASAFLAERAKIDGIVDAIRNYREHNEVVTPSPLETMFLAIDGALGSTAWP